MDVDSPLKPTCMRNNFDHFDDRLDTWWRTSVNHNSTDYAIASDATNFGGLDQQDIFRLLNPETGEVVFWGTDTLSSP